MKSERDISYKTLFKSVQQDSFINFLALAAGLWGLVSAVFTPGTSPAVLLLIGIILLLSGFSVVKSFKNLRSKALPDPSDFFVPFPDEESEKQLPRDKLTKDLAQKIEASQDKHVMLVSPSGAGKTTMMYKLIPRIMTGYEHIYISHYDNPIRSFADKIGNTRFGSDPAFIEAVTEFSRSIEGKTEDFEKSLRHILDNFITSETLFVFDQIERYFLRYDTQNEKSNDSYTDESNKVRIALRLLRLHPKIRTVFSVRSEFIFGSLSSIFNLKSDGSDVDDHVEFYFLWGINQDDDKDALIKIKHYVNENMGGNAILDNILSAGGLDDRRDANTFMLNLAGYLFEKLDRDSDLRKRILEVDGNRDKFIDVFLDAAFEGFVASESVGEREEFDSVLYALASENRTSGQACSCERLARLCHRPLSDVQRVLDFLKSAKIIRGRKINTDEYYRISHEKISDRVLRSDQLQLNSKASDATRYLTENRIPTRNLKAVKQFPNYFDNPLGSMSYLSVCIFGLYGVVRLLLPDFALWMTAPLAHAIMWLTDKIYLTNGVIQPYYSASIYYVPHLVVHLAWLSYIDRINRAIISNVGSKGARMFGNLLAPLGAFLGVAVSFVPELFAIPIIFVGLAFGVLMICMALTSEFRGQAKTDFLLWGFRSILNVTFVFVAVWCLSVAGVFDASGAAPGRFSIFSAMNREQALIVIIWLEAAAMFWFWMHIYPEQNNRSIWAANIAMFDKGRAHEQ